MRSIRSQSYAFKNIFNVLFIQSTRHLVNFNQIIRTSEHIRILFKISMRNGYKIVGEKNGWDYRLVPIFLM